MDINPGTAGTYGAYVVALLGMWVAIGSTRRMKERRTRSRIRDRSANADVEPVSLHPVIDAGLCVGCGACTHACPEGKILSLSAGKAALTDPASCIGHGACKTACPVGAIDLVFGSSRRGVDIPVVSPDFETTVPGVFVAGELGGMGLVANAVEQGRKAIETIAARGSGATAPVYDVVIVGGGPAGIAATLAAKERRLSALTLEQDSLGGTVARFPRGKIVMTRPALLPLYGKVRLKRVRKERLIKLWSRVLSKTGAQIHYGVRVEGITKHGDILVVSTSRGTCHALNVVLAMGRRGTPKTLGIPGETLPKVSHGLIDARHFAKRHVAVVGGGDSALEAALELSRNPVASVTLICRTSTPSRARTGLRKQLDTAVADGLIHLMTDARLTEIQPDRIAIECRGETEIVANDAVVVAIGGTLPTGMLAMIGVDVERKFGTA